MRVSGALSAKLGVALLAATALSASGGECYLAASDGPRRPGYAAEPVPLRQFRWEGFCSLRCRDGSFRQYRSGGQVAAPGLYEATTQAEAELRARASSEGTVVGGSVHIDRVEPLEMTPGLDAG